MDDPTQIIPYSDEEKASTASKTSKETREIHNKYNLLCPFHKSQIDVICIHENTDDLRLFCVSCLIEEKSKISNPCYRLLVLGKFFEKAVVKPKDGKTSAEQIEAETKSRYLDFVTNDYRVKYDEKMNERYQKIVNEVDDIVNGLNAYKEKVKNNIAEMINKNSMRIDEVTREAGKFIEEGEYQEQNQFNSVEEIYEHLEKTKNFDQVLEFLNGLYLRAKDKIIEGRSSNRAGQRVLNKINEFEKIYYTETNEKIDSTQLEGKYFPSFSFISFTYIQNISPFY